MAKGTTAKRRRIDATEKLQTQFETGPAPFTREFCAEVEAAIAEDRFGIPRRMAFACLTRTGAQLIDGIKDDRASAVALACAMEEFGEYAERLKELIAWVEKAQFRAAFALAYREDMDEILAEAKAAMANEEQA